MAGSGPFKVFVWPQSHREVPDGPGLKLVLLGPEAPHDNEEDLKRLYHVIQDNHASGPRVYKNTTLYLAMARAPYLRAQEVARKLLALEDIQSDRGLVLSDEQKSDLTRLLKEAHETVPVLVKSSYTGMLEPQDAKGAFRFFDLTAYVRTQPTLQAAVAEVLRAEDLLLSKLDPSYLTQGPWGLWPENEPFLTLRDLRDYFLCLPHLPFLEREEAIKDSVIQGIRIRLFELGVRSGDGFAQVWHAGKPPRPEDVFFGEAYVLARPGTLPRPEQLGGESPQHEGDGGSRLPEPAPGPLPPEREPGKKTAKTKVTVTLERLELARIPALVDLAKALRDAGGVVRIKVEIEAVNPGGLNETVLRTSALEILDQYNLEADWREE